MRPTVAMLVSLAVCAVGWLAVVHAERRLDDRLWPPTPVPCSCTCADQAAPPLLTVRECAPATRDTSGRTVPVTTPTRTRPPFAPGTPTATRTTAVPLPPDARRWAP